LLLSDPRVTMSSSGPSTFTSISEIFNCIWYTGNVTCTTVVDGVEYEQYSLLPTLAPTTSVTAGPFDEESGVYYDPNTDTYSYNENPQDSSGATLVITVLIAVFMMVLFIVGLLTVLQKCVQFLWERM